MVRTLLPFLIKIVLLVGLLWGSHGRSVAQSADDIVLIDLIGGSDSTRGTEYWFLPSNFESLPQDTVVTMQVGGQEGWHSFSVPGVQFDQLLGDLWVQGIPGSPNPDGNPSIISWDESEGKGFIAPNNIHDYTKDGRGYFIYLANDDNPQKPGRQGGFPKTLTFKQNTADFVKDIPVSATDKNGNDRIDGMEGFNLLGNPFGRNISVGAVKEALKTIGADINPYLYVWNSDWGNGNGGFEPLSDNDTIGPYQAFWVRYLDIKENSIVRFDRNRLIADGNQFSSNVDESTGEFELRLSNSQWYDSYHILLDDQAAPGQDEREAYKLFSLKTGSINLFSRMGNRTKLAENFLPSTLEEPLQIPLSFSAGDQSSLSFQWDDPKHLPRGWELLLKDQERSREINLRSVNSYSIDLEQPDTEPTMGSKSSRLLNDGAATVQDGRFSLVIRPTAYSAQNTTELPESISLKPNYPNPFTTSTRIPFELNEPAEVTLTVWNMIGQKVATLVDDERKDAGLHDGPEVNWEATNLPSGMYIARLEAGGQVFTRKMTLIK